MLVSIGFAYATLSIGRVVYGHCLTVSYQTNAFLKANCTPLSLLSFGAERDGTVRSKTAARWSYSGFEQLDFPSYRILVPGLNTLHQERLQS